jgi:hypothetical protein
MPNAKQQRADLHGHGKARKLVRRLTPREVAEIRCPNVAYPGDRRRRAGIEELRRSLDERFGGAYVRGGAHG